MTRDVLSYFVALLLAMLWGFLLAPRLLRQLGVPIPLKWRERKQLHLNPGQNVLWGVFGWGVSMIIYDRTSHYLLWILTRNLADKPTFWRFAGSILLWSLIGVVFGVFTALPNRKEDGN